MKLIEIRSETQSAIKGCFREAESLRSKDGQRLSNCKGFAKSRTSNNSEKLEISLCIRDKAEDLIGCPWSSGPQMTPHYSSASLRR